MNRVTVKDMRWPFWVKVPGRWRKGLEVYRGVADAEDIETAKKMAKSLWYFLYHGSPDDEDQIFHIRNRQLMWETISKIMESRINLSPEERKEFQIFLKDYVFWRRPTDQQSGNRRRSSEAHERMSYAYQSFMMEFRRPPSVRELMKRAGCGTHQAVAFLRDASVVSFYPPQPDYREFKVG